MKKYIFLSIFIILPTIMFGATEQATFESFYIKDYELGWSIIVAFATAVIVGGVIFFTGGTASPIVLGIGSWIGSLQGLSGIAATNYGLALLGGGSIASGGLGIIGGTALLTATLTFSTELILDYPIDRAINYYNKNELIENSKNIISLPKPINTTGTKNYKEIIEKLEKEIIINEENLLSSDSIQNKLKNIIETSKFDEKDLKELVLKSYLHLTTYDYDKAKLTSAMSIELARQLDIKRTFPAFIYSISNIYSDDFYSTFMDVNQNYFRYSILAEPKNEFIPLMFAIYIQNISNVLNMEDKFNYEYLNEIVKINFDIEKNSIKNEVLAILIVEYFKQIKLEQQKILSITGTINEEIKNSKKAVDILNNSINQYQNLLIGLDNIFANDVYQKIKKDLNKNQEIDFEDLKLKYKVSESELIGKIEEFKEKQEVYKNDKNNITYIIIFISLMILLILFVNRIKNKRIDRKYL